MAKVRYAAPIANIEGAWAPGCVCRQKKFKVGKKIVLGPQEVFHRRKRDYKHKPPTEAEQQGIERFRRAEAHRKQEMADSERASYWQARFAAQREKPEEGNKKVYHRLDAFVRAMLMKNSSQLTSV